MRRPSSGCWIRSASTGIPDKPSLFDVGTIGRRTEEYSSFRPAASSGRPRRRTKVRPTCQRHPQPPSSRTLKHSGIEPATIVARSRPTCDAVRIAASATGDRKSRRWLPLKGRPVLRDGRTEIRHSFRTDPGKGRPVRRGDPKPSRPNLSPLGTICRTTYREPRSPLACGSGRNISGTASWGTDFSHALPHLTPRRQRRARAKSGCNQRCLTSVLLALEPGDEVRMLPHRSKALLEDRVLRDDPAILLTPVVIEGPKQGVRRASTNMSSRRWSGATRALDPPRAEPSRANRTLRPARQQSRAGHCWSVSGRGSPT